MTMDKRVAIIDLGSNSIRMNIINVNSNGAYYIVDQSKEMVRLSEGMGPEKTLKEEPMDRTIKTIKLFEKLMETYKVEKVWSFATAAVRSAKNGQEFIDRVKSETGHEIKVIDGKKEAYYDYLGVINTIDIRECLIVDIGGGSTELVLVKDRELVESISLPFGSVTLSESFLKYKTDKESIDGLENFMRGLLDDVPWLRGNPGIPVVGLGGIIRNIARIHKVRKDISLPDIHNHKLRHKDVAYVLKQVVGKDFDEIRKIPGISKSRVDIMAGGVVPIDCIMKYVKSDNLVISGNGLREGVFYEKYLKKREDVLVVNNVLEHSLDNIAKKYKVNREHAIQVKNIALTLFEDLRDIHGLDKKYRKILHVAALIHDIGMHVGYYNHHVHGFYLALNSRINGLETDEMISVAYLIGLHRDTKLRIDLKEYKEIVGNKKFKELKKLAVFLKLSEKLDRGEFGNLKGIETLVGKKTVKIVVEAFEGENLELEVSQARGYSELFKKNFGYRLEIEERLVE